MHLSIKDEPKKAMLEPVTKSLEELEKNDVLIAKDGDKRKVICKAYYLKNLRSEIVKDWNIEEMEAMKMIPYTPKKITVFKHKGKRYSVDQIIKNVKPL